MFFFRGFWVFVFLGIIKFGDIGGFWFFVKWVLCFEEEIYLKILVKHGK